MPERARQAVRFRRRCRCSTYSLTLLIGSCGIGVDGSGPGARVHLGGPRQCLRVDVLLDVRHFAISNGNVEDPLVLVRLIRSIDFSRSDTDDQNPVSLRHEFGGLWVFHFHLFGRLLKYSCQFRVPAVGAGQRPALAWNDPLNIFGSQRQQILLIVAAHCCKKILHNLDVILCAHRNLSISHTSARVLPFQLGRAFATSRCSPNGTAKTIVSASSASPSDVATTVDPIARARGANASGGRRLVTVTSMFLRAKAWARAWPIFPNPTIA